MLVPMENRCIFDIAYGSYEAQKLDVYLPDKEVFPVFVYFHGGGIEAGDKQGEKIIFSYLAAHGVAVVSANYRMYPDAKYPDFLEDAASAVAWTFANMKKYGTVEKIYVGGSSAGGYISQMLCFDPSWLAKHGIQPLDIAGYVLDAGQPTCHFNVLRERGIDTRRVIIDDSAPLYHIAAGKQYPPMLIIVSDDDIPGRLEQTMLLIATLKSFGNTEYIYLQMMHGKHCAYTGAADENGDSILGKLALEYIIK